MKFVSNKKKSSNFKNFKNLNLRKFDFKKLENQRVKVILI